MYNIENSVLREKTPVEACACTCEDTPAVETENAKAILVSRVTCPNCKVAEQLLQKAGVAYEKVIAEEHPDMCRQYGIKGAPTLVITDGENFQTHYSVPEIKKFLATL